MANEEAIPSGPLGPEAEENIENTVLIPCSICGRTFKSESLLKHQSVCQKNATKKRRVFDSMKQRIQGTELAEYIPIPVVPPKPKLIPVVKPAVKKLSKDDQRSGESPNVGQHSNTPGGAEKTPVKAAVSRSHSTGVHGGGARSGGGNAAFREERCPHCDRTFGWKAFSRHEEWCREHKSRLAQAHSPAAVLKAKEMLEARIKYRAPVLGKCKRPTNREKYAGGAQLSPAVHKLSADYSPMLSSMKATVSSSNKVVSESRQKVMSKAPTSHISVVAAPTPHQPSTPSGTGSTPRRGLSPSKKISRVLQSPWQPSGGVDKSSGSDEVISQPVTGGNRSSTSLCIKDRMNGRPGVASSSGFSSNESTEIGALGEAMGTSLIISVAKVISNLSCDPMINIEINSMNKILADIGVDSSHVGDYDKVFGCIPPLEYSEDKDKDEELLRWIRHVKAMLKKQNCGARSEEKCEERAVDSLDTQSEAKKRCLWEMEGTLCDEKMQRTFVYEALNSSDESSDGVVVCSSDIILQNGKVNGLHCSDSGKQVKDCASKDPTTAEATGGADGTLFNQKTTVPVFSSCADPDDQGRELPRCMAPLVTAKSGDGSSPPRERTPPICYGQLIGAIADSGCEAFNAHKKVARNQPRRAASTKDCKGKIEMVKNRSKLPVPVSNFHGKQKSVRAILAAYNDMMSSEQPSYSIDNSTNLPAKKLNNTFILPGKAFEECYFDGDSLSVEPSNREMEMDSLESSSGGSSPLLQRGIIHKCVSGEYGSKTPAEQRIKVGSHKFTGSKSSGSEKSSDLEECRIRGRMQVKNAESGSERGNVTLFHEDEGKECSMEACSVPVHLLMKHNDSSRENSSGTGVGYDLVGKGNSQETLFEATTLASPVAGEARAKAMQGVFSDQDFCHYESNDDWSYHMSGDLVSNSPSDCYLGNAPGSPLNIEDLLVSSEIRGRKSKNGKRKGRAGREPLDREQENDRDEGINRWKRQPSPLPVAEVTQCHHERFARESTSNVHQVSKDFLPRIQGDFSHNVCAENSVERVSDSQHKWLNLIKNLSESELGCTEPREEVLEMPDRNEIVFPQRRGVSKKSSTFGLTLSDRKAAENRVKARLFGENWQDRPSSQKLNPSRSGWTPSCRQKMVTLPSARALPEMAASDKGRRSIPLSPVIAQPNPKPLLSLPLIRPTDKEESKLAPKQPPPSRQSTYDPFSRAEMQLKELLSDEGAARRQSLGAPPATNGLPKEAVQNGAHEQLENVTEKTNGNEADSQGVHRTEKQAKEVELPDLFTETSTQLDFEMPNVMRSRDRSISTKRRALKPTPQNMGIELNSIRRDNYAGTTTLDKSRMGNMFEDEEVEQITSIMNMGFCISHMSGSQGNARASTNVAAGDEIDSIHQSINMVALGLTNLSTASPCSLADKDNNNEGCGFSVGQRGGGSSDDSDLEGGGERRRVRVRPRGVAAKGAAPAAGEKVSSHESLNAATQPLVIGKPCVDSAYSSLNRPVFRTIEQAKEAAAAVSAFDLPNHGSSSEGENDQADEWSDGEGGPGGGSQNRLSTLANEAKVSSSVKYAKFCHNCGSKYPLSEAKFCCVCGEQRLAV